MKRLALALIALISWHTASAALAIDGSSGFYLASGTSYNITLSTTNSNDLIVVMSAQNGQAISSVTGTGLTFTLRTKTTGTNDIEEWTAVASSALSSEVITISYASTATAAVGTAFGVSGTNTSSPYDSNASIPVENTTAADPTFSTTGATTLVFGAVRTSSVSSPTAGTGWTLIYAPATKYFMAQYQTFSSSQTGTTFAVGTGTGNENGSIVDAVVPAGGATSTPPVWVIQP